MARARPAQLGKRSRNFSACRENRNRLRPNVLSEHEIEGLDKMTPQSQAQLLLERSINHYRGANDQIATRVDSWRGKIKLDQSLNSLFTTALNSDDLRVREAAIEIDLACS